MYSSRRLALAPGTDSWEARGAAVTYTERCSEVQELKYKMGMPSPCDDCVYSGRYKAQDVTLVCVVCGFFCRPGHSFGYTENYVFGEHCVLAVHLDQFLRSVVQKAFGLIVGERQLEDFNQAERQVLSAIGVLEDNKLNSSANEFIKRSLDEEKARAGWFENFWRDRVKFIRESGNWRESVCRRNPIRGGSTPKLFMDADSLREALASPVLEELERLSEDKAVTGRNVEGMMKRPSVAKLAMFSVLRGNVQCLSNALVEAELLKALVTLNRAVVQPGKYEGLWLRFVDHLSNYDFDQATFQVASVLTRLYAEHMPGRREPEVNDAYHFVFAAQHSVDAVVTGDRFLLTVPEFLQKIATGGREETVEMAATIHENLYPGFARLFGRETIEQGFMALFKTEVRFFDRNDPSTDAIRSFLGIEVGPLGGQQQ